MNCWLLWTNPSKMLSGGKHINPSISLMLELLLVLFREREAILGEVEWLLYPNLNARYTYKGYSNIRIRMVELSVWRTWRTRALFRLVFKLFLSPN